MAMAEPEASIKIIDRCRVSPPPTSVPTSSLPLTFFDIPWLFGVPPQMVLFYGLPNSEYSYFTRTILPSLRSSLSVALQKFYPFAAKLVRPPPPNKPYILYTDGDSVPLTIAESKADFRVLTGNGPQDVKLYRHLVPQLPPPHQNVSESDNQTSILFPLLAVQITLFPCSGVCIGVQFKHVVADGMSFSHFMKSWASICKTGKLQHSLPFHDRDSIKDPDRLGTIFWKEWQDWDAISVPKHDPKHATVAVRSTFVVRRVDIDRLKGWILNQFNKLGLEPLRISGFVAICAYTWVCVVKSIEGDQVLSSGGSEDDDSSTQLRYFCSLVDCRGRVAGIPETYFGNCIVPFSAPIQKNLLVGQNGIALAARTIATEMKELENGAVRGGEKLISDRKVMWRWTIPVAVTVGGSPRLKLYDTDFGWGRPVKTALAHAGVRGSVALSDSRDEEGGLEIDVALGKDAMDQFTARFEQGLKSLFTISGRL